MESLSSVQNAGNGDVVEITKRNRSDLGNEDWTAVESTCTSDITDMSSLFATTEFAGGYELCIQSRYVSNVTNMSDMFAMAFAVGNVSNVTDLM